MKRSELRDAITAMLRERLPALIASEVVFAVAPGLPTGTLLITIVEGSLPDAPKTEVEPKRGSNDRDARHRAVLLAEMSRPVKGNQ